MCKRSLSYSSKLRDYLRVYIHRSLSIRQKERKKNLPPYNQLESCKIWENPRKLLELSNVSIVRARDSEGLGRDIGRAP
jgi:hypothetical protein